jgi:hypothetical protein
MSKAKLKRPLDVKVGIDAEFNIDTIAFGKERSAMCALVQRLGETFRDDWFPGMSTWEALQLSLIMLCLFRFHSLTGRAQSVSSLSRSSGIPRATLDRKLTTLKRLGYVEQHGTRLMLSVEGLNREHLIQGFKRRISIIRATLAKTLKVFAA